MSMKNPSRGSRPSRASRRYCDRPSTAIIRDAPRRLENAVCRRSRLALALRRTAAPAARSRPRLHRLIGHPPPFHRLQGRRGSSLCATRWSATARKHVLSPVTTSPKGTRRRCSGADAVRGGAHSRVGVEAPLRHRRRSGLLLGATVRRP
jgi:hypothetical protein